MAKKIKRNPGTRACFNQQESREAYGTADKVL